MMTELRPIKSAAETAGDVAQRIASALDWLPDPMACDECGGPCEQAIVYDPVLHEETAAWKCRECDAAFYRDERTELAFSPWRE